MWYIWVKMPREENDLFDVLNLANFWQLIVADCDFAESYGRFLSE